MPAKKKPAVEPEQQHPVASDKCKHCGACQHCGSRPSNPFPYVPYPSPWPQPYRPYTQPGRITYGPNTSGGQYGLMSGGWNA